MLTTRRASDAGPFRQYSLTGFDEMFAAPGVPHSHYAQLHERLTRLNPDEFERRCRVADLMMRHQGITFTVYGRAQGVERIIPFDPLPRLAAPGERARIERGLQQGGRALDPFVH